MKISIGMFILLLSASLSGGVHAEEQKLYDANGNVVEVLTAEDHREYRKYDSNGVEVEARVQKGAEADQNIDPE